jgi:hypothetical protein
VLVQGTFDELGTPLRDTVFTVVDLETTGGSHRDCAITEIGAVKVCGGEVLGEFQTLVNPAQSIPPFIAVLTGITDSTRCRPSWSSPGGRSWSPTTHPSTWASCGPAARSCRSAGPPSTPSTPPGWPVGC